MNGMNAKADPLPKVPVRTFDPELDARKAKQAQMSAKTDAEVDFITQNNGVGRMGMKAEDTAFEPGMSHKHGAKPEAYHD